ncbi:MAG: hypothetical protein IJP14_04925 [Clostridia bacterium]|nr:hypothetical protein [Clostridia bacterium]
MLKHKVFRVISLLCVILLVLPTAVVFAEKGTENTQPAPAELEQAGLTEETEEAYRIRYEQVASNDESILYADMQKGFFALQNKASGDIWYSTPNDSLLDKISGGSDKWTVRSQLTIGFLYKEDVVTADSASKANSQLGCVEMDGGIQVQKLGDGIRVTYHFVEIGITIPVEYRLQGASLSATIDVANIDEGDECLLTEINLLPAFGAGNWQTEGQLLVPDGSGALIDFNNGVECLPYEQMVYGKDQLNFVDIDSSVTEEIRLPVFATLMPNKALMGVITQGDGSASIRALNGNEDRGYNAVSSIFKMRALDILSMFKNTSNRRDLARLSGDTEQITTYQVVYTPLTGADANYVGVANVYRQYLVDEKGLSKQAATPGLALNMLGSIDVKAAFLGIEYSKQQSLTTFEQAQAILSALKERGVDSLSVRYQGWSNYGLLNKKVPTKAKALSNLGGKKALNILNAYATDNAIALYPDVDFLRFRSGSKKQSIKTAFNEVVYHTERMRSVFATKLELTPYRFLTPQNLKTVTDRYLKSYSGTGISAISLGTLGEYAYSNHSQHDGFHRYDYPETVAAVLQNYRDSGLALSVEGANAFAAVYAARIYNTPTLTSGYDMFDHEIPFYQIVFHGYTTMTAMPMAQTTEAAVNFLKAVESGSELLFDSMYESSALLTGTRYDHLYATQYTLWMDQAVELYTRYQPLLKTIYDQTIVAHTELASDVMQTTYENGVSVIVNYSNVDYVSDSLTVKPLDYAVQEGGAAA